MPRCSYSLVSIIIPVHNQFACTSACLASLHAHPPHIPYEIIIVDDASTDDTCALLGLAVRNNPKIRLVKNSKNRGFAISCNYGARTAHGDMLLFLNNDTEVTAGWFTPLYEELSIHPDIGVVGPKLIFPDGTIQHCGKVWSALYDHFSQPHHLYYRYPGNHPAVNKSRDYQMLTGACLLVRTAEFNNARGFDEAYLNGWEDDDLCYAYRAQGLRVYYCAESTVVHHQSKTLNERMSDIERSLPDAQSLMELDHTLKSGMASHDDVNIAVRVQALYSSIEQELVKLRSRFNHNRTHFMGKWGSSITRDDLVYCTVDSIPLHKALPDLKQPTPELSSNARGTLPLVSIVILTRNRLDVTQDCIFSIQQHTPESHEIIFIDNGSTDGTVPWLREQSAVHGNYRLIENGINRGFAAGCNQGMLAASGQYILLLNNDVVVTPGWLGGMMECFNNPAVGIVGPMTNNISGIQEWPWVDYAASDGLDPFAVAFRSANRYRRVPSRRIVGFCMMFRVQLMEQIGLLDEKFGSGNFEDDDYCLRTALEGYQNIIAGDVFIHHVGSATFRGNNIDYTQAMMSNQALFNEKWSRPVVDTERAKKIVCLKTLESAAEKVQAGETDAAVELLLKDGLGQIPEEPRIYSALAAIFLDAGMYRDALDVLKESPEKINTSQLLTLQALIGSSMFAEAQCLLEQLADVDDSAEITALRAGLLQGRNEPNAAAHAYEQALTKDSGLTSAFIGLAEIALQAGHDDMAFSLAELAFRSDPTGIRARTLFSSLLNDSKRIETAAQRVAEARHFFPNDRDCTFLHIDLLLRKGDNVEALRVIEHALCTFKHSDGLLAAALSVREQVGWMTIDPVRYQAGITVSLCMIMKNEAANLAQCLSSLKPLVDEIIIVDTGSDDSSREIACIFGAQVVELAWKSDFSAARNASIKHASGNWILVMDADEVISTSDYIMFRQLINSSAGSSIAFILETRNYTNRVDLENWRANSCEYPREERGRGWIPSDKIRLFPNISGVIFENPIHEMVEPSIYRLGVTESKAPFFVHHYGYLDDDRQQRKREYYYELGKKKYEESNGAPHAIVELAIQAAALGKYDEAIELWRKALLIDPESYLVHFNLGHAYLQKGMFQAGSTASRRATELRENYREALVNQLMCDLCLGCGLSLLETINKALESNQDYPILLLMRAIVYAVHGIEKEAKLDFTALVNNRVEFTSFLKEVIDKLQMAESQTEINNLIAVVQASGINMNELI